MNTPDSLTASLAALSSPLIGNIPIEPSFNESNLPIAPKGMHPPQPAEIHESPLTIITWIQEIYSQLASHSAQLKSHDSLLLAQISSRAGFTVLGLAQGRIIDDIPTTRNFTFHIFSLPNIQNTNYTCNSCNQIILLDSTVLATKKEKSSAVKVNHWACERRHLPDSFIEARRLNKCDIDLRQPRLANATLVEVMNAVANPPTLEPAPQQAEEQPAERAPLPAMEPLEKIPREVLPSNNFLMSLRAVLYIWQNQFS
ncbi:hypothetical protein MBANPS3_012337 [Mucor bainieri]